MLKSSLFLLALTVLLLPACGLVDDIIPDIEFSVDGGAINFTVPEGAAGTYELITADVPSDVAAELANENIDDERIKSVKLASALFKVAANAGIDISIIDNASVSVTAPGLPALTLASSDLSGISGNEVTLDIRDVDLVQYLLAESATYTLSVTINAEVPAPTMLSVTPSFDVVASPL